jgi:hypothetical protein
VAYLNDEKNNFEIRCSEYFVVRFVMLAIFLIVAILNIKNTEFADSPARFLFWIFWISLLLILLISSPDLIIHEDGLTIVTFRKSVSVGWEEFKEVHKNSISTNIYIYSPRFSFLTKLLIPYPIRVGRWWKNYSEAIEFLRLKVGDKYFETY